MAEIDVNVIQTGSTGNCLILNRTLALDMGVTWKKVAPYSKTLKLVFASHEHGEAKAARITRAAGSGLFVKIFLYEFFQ